MRAFIAKHNPTCPVIFEPHDNNRLTEYFGRIRNQYVEILPHFSGRINESIYDEISRSIPILHSSPEKRELLYSEMKQFQEGMLFLDNLCVAWGVYPDTQRIYEPGIKLYLFEVVKIHRVVLGQHVADIINLGTSLPNDERIIHEWDGLKILVSSHYITFWNRNPNHFIELPLFVWDVLKKHLRKNYRNPTATVIEH